MKAAVEVLHSLYLRHLQNEEFIDLVCPMYTAESISLLKDVYNWTMVDANDIDERKYTLCKKLSEVGVPARQAIWHNSNH